VEAALGGWFQTGNLSALRELALLWLAAALADGPRRHLPGGGDPGSGHTRERVVAALSGGPEGETLIRQAARIAAQRRLAESAGGTYHQLADEDIPAALLAFAHAHNATQLVLGATRRTWLGALRPAASIRSRVIRRGDGLDVHIVTCPPTTHGVPAAACERKRRRTVMRQQNTSWPGRVRHAAPWGPRRAASREGEASPAVGLARGRSRGSRSADRRRVRKFVPALGRDGQHPATRRFGRGLARQPLKTTTINGATVLTNTKGFTLYSVAPTPRTPPSATGSARRSSRRSPAPPPPGQA
jgi:nucleotide-binding universal stress UspA family protein